MPLCNANPTSVDPDGAELAALAQLVDFSGLRVLEVGCGDGRLTWRYAGPPEEVQGIDPDEEAIPAARAATPPVLRDRVCFDVASPVSGTCREITSTSHASAGLWVEVPATGSSMARRWPSVATAFASRTTLTADFSLGERSGSQSLHTASSSDAS
jgi:predicted RNA methylase